MRARRRMGLTGVVGLAARAGIALALLAGNQPATPATAAAFRGVEGTAAPTPSEGEGGGSGSSGEYGTAAGASARPRLSAAADRECSDFASQAAAQSFFLKQGGPATDPHDLDPDNNGLACGGNTAPFRGLLSIDFRGGAFAGALSSVTDDCLGDRSVKIFKVRPGPDKRMGSDVTDVEGAYEVAKNVTRGKFYAKAGVSGQCTAERSPTLKLPLGRVEITPTGVFFPGPAQSRQLSVQVFDGSDRPVASSAPVFWSSSDPSDVGVSRSGLATSNTSNGSAQITANLNGVVSAPVLATVTPLPPGAVVLNDANIVGEPVATDPDAEPSFENTFLAVLQGIDAPSVGDLLINAGDIPVVGRVVAIQDNDDGTFLVTLGQVGLDEAFPDLEIDEQMELAHAPAQINPNVLAGYDVVRRGDTFTFTPKPETVAAASGGGWDVSTAAVGEIEMFPFSKCETSTPFDSSPLKFKVPPVFNISVTPSIDFVSSAANGLERFVVRVEPAVSLELDLTVVFGFEATIKCEEELFFLPAPVSGPLAAIVSGLIPVGVGVEAGGKWLMQDFGLGAKVEARATLEAGIACAALAGCGFVRNAIPDVSFKPKGNAPLGGFDQKVEVELKAYGFLKATVGNPLLARLQNRFGFLRRLKFDAFKVSVGGKATGTFTGIANQVIDTGYRSEYKAALEAKAGLAENLSDLARFFGVSSISGVALVVAADLGRSATGTLTADKASFVKAEKIRFDAHLDSVDFLGGYNVRRVLLVRQSGNTAAVQGATTAAPGQTDFRFTFTAPNSGETKDFFLFVVTNLLSVPETFFSLELAKATFSGQIAFASSRDGDYEIYVMNADGTGQVNRTNNAAQDWQPSWSPDGTKIAFTSNRDGNSGIYLMNADGTGVDNLSNAGDLDPAWSPDGTKIAFRSHRDGNAEVYVMNADGTGQVRRTNNAAGDADPAWSPDGTKIAFTRVYTEGGSDVYVMNADETGTPLNRTNTGTDAGPSWSPDGTKIAFYSARDGNAEVYVMNADGTGQVRRTTNAAGDAGPAWSPDGTKIVFWSDRDEESESNNEIYVMNADGSGQARLTNNAADDVQPDW